MPATAQALVPQKPFSVERNQQIIDQFTRDGYAIIPNILSPEEIATLRERIERYTADSKMWETHNRCDDLCILRLFELDRLFVDFLTREPMISLMEQMIGPDCHVMAMNSIRNVPGRAIDTYHVDDALWFPLPDEVPRHDARIKFPNLAAGWIHALTDIESDEYGPLQVVPGSHYSGRNPNDPKDPTFEGRKAVSVLVKAGDAYMQHPQVWHRGAPNTSDRTRCVFGVGWSKRFISQRFFPYLNYQVPPHVLEGASDRLLRVLGKHTQGAYG